MFFDYNNKIELVNNELFCYFQRTRRSKIYLKIEISPRKITMFEFIHSFNIIVNK